MNPKIGLRLGTPLLFCSFLMAEVAGAQIVLKGAGSTFPAPLYERWFTAYNKLDPTVRFSYQGVGSGRGQSLIEQQAVDFGASDAPMNYESLATAIGYVELPYALQDHLSQAAIKNAAGVYVKASTASIAAALAMAAIPDDFRLSVVNAPGAAAYPIAGVTWLLVYQHLDDTLKAQKLAAFLKWALTSGQKMAGELNYAPLPDRLKSRVLAEINGISPHS